MISTNPSSDSIEILQPLNSSSFLFVLPPGPITGQDWKKTTDDVFDEVTLRNLQQLISQGIINTLENVIATGKEGTLLKI